MQLPRTHFSLAIPKTETKKDQDRPWITIPPQILFLFFGFLALKTPHTHTHLLTPNPPHHNQPVEKTKILQINADSASRRNSPANLCAWCVFRRTPFPSSNEEGSNFPQNPPPTSIPYSNLNFLWHLSCTLLPAKIESLIIFLNLPPPSLVEPPGMHYISCCSRLKHQSWVGGH